MKNFLINCTIIIGCCTFFLVSCKKGTVDLPAKPPPKDVVFLPPNLGFYVVGYFPSYRTVAEYPDRMFKMCNIINYAFFSVNAQGTVDITNPEKFDSVYVKAKANGAKIFISINNAANFTKMAATPSGRNSFTRDLMIKVRQLNVDGVDIDWEYPKTTDGTDSTFTFLMKELSDSLHRNGKYYLTAAITPGRYAGAIRDAIRTEVFGYVDFFNVMIYDDFSTSISYKQHTDINLYNYCMNYWLNTRNLPREKLVAGIPGYGRNAGAAQITTSYKTILATGVSAGPAPLYLSDSAILTKTDGSTFTSYYNGQLTVKKKAADAKLRCNGIMFWEIGHDAADDRSLIKAACDTIGRAY
ncbi:glycoside hydrolase family 18 protein [Niabella sp. CC-SYL272]|uniref:glycoside hydrolase family 18 protein n=1 Tax=Niabella agricola TaxID=2891571 RepID=UPI001F316D4C|nr:glycoside hydrolase family 18 protein [Niabella agricola]MCF3110694.1 glycoside hydrolase family 18 protein [Niabella agricola]